MSRRSVAPRTAHLAEIADHCRLQRGHCCYPEPMTGSPHESQAPHDRKTCARPNTYTTDTELYFFSFAAFGLKNDVILAIPSVFTFLSASTPRDPCVALRFVAPLAVFFSVTTGAAAAAWAAARSARYAFRRARLGSACTVTEMKHPASSLRQHRYSHEADSLIRRSQLLHDL